MSSQKRLIKATNQENQQSLEHTEVFEDSLLPNASEIERLTKIDPNIIAWLKERAEKEQDFRHSAFMDQSIKMESLYRREHNTTRYGLTIYFVLVSFCIGASYFLLKEGHNVQGSLFGGAVVILALAVLVGRNIRKKL